MLTPNQPQVVHVFGKPVCQMYHVLVVLFRTSRIMCDAHTGNSDVLRQPVEKCVTDKFCKEQTRGILNDPLQRTANYQRSQTIKN